MCFKVVFLYKGLIGGSIWTILKCNLILQGGTCKLRVQTRYLGRIILSVPQCQSQPRPCWVLILSNACSIQKNSMLKTVIKTYQVLRGSHGYFYGLFFIAGCVLLEGKVNKCVLRKICSVSQLRQQLGCYCLTRRRSIYTLSLLVTFHKILRDTGPSRGHKFTPAGPREHCVMTSDSCREARAPPHVFSLSCLACTSWAVLHASRTGVPMTFGKSPVLGVNLYF